MNIFMDLVTHKSCDHVIKFLVHIVYIVESVLLHSWTILLFSIDVLNRGKDSFEGFLDGQPIRFIKPV